MKQEATTGKASPSRRHVPLLTAAPSAAQTRGWPSPGPYLRPRVVLLRVVLLRILPCGRARARGGRGRQVSPGDERAHVGVVGEDVVPDELTEEQHQVHKLHLLTLAVWIRCEGTEPVKNSGSLTEGAGGGEQRQ